jgi:hypothetical protein
MVGQKIKVFLVGHFRRTLTILWKMEHQDLGEEGVAESTDPQVYDSVDSVLISRINSAFNPFRIELLGELYLSFLQRGNSTKATWVDRSAAGKAKHKLFPVPVGRMATTSPPVRISATALLAAAPIIKAEERPHRASSKKYIGRERNQSTRE